MNIIIIFLCSILVFASIADIVEHNRLIRQKTAIHALKAQNASKAAKTKPTSCSDVMDKISNAKGAKLMSYSNGSAKICFIGKQSEFYDFLMNMKQWENVGKINSMNIKNKENNHIEAMLNIDFGKV